MPVHLSEQFGGEHRARRAGGDDPAALENRDAVGVGGGECEIVQHNHCCAPRIHVRACLIEHAMLVANIEARSGLVEHRDLAVLRPRAGEGHPRSLAPRKRGHGAIGVGDDLSRPHRAIHKRVIIDAFRAATPGGPAHAHDVFDPEGKRDVVRLRQHGSFSRALGGIHINKVAPTEANRSCGGSNVAGEHAQQR